MASNISHYPRCTCSAIFSTSSALNAHLEENRSLEKYLTARIEICKGHAKAGEGEDSPTESEDDSGQQSNVRKQHYCPFQGCKRMSAPFASRQRLRRHFEQHVDCEEVCVCCHQVMTRVRNFIRHAGQHKFAGRTKLAYMNNMCEELRDRANEELENLENCRRLNSASTLRKRTGHVAELDIHSTESKRRRRDDAGQSTANLQPSFANGVYPLQLMLDEPDVAEGGVLVRGQHASNQLAANVVPLSLGNNEVASDLASLQTDVLAANSTLEQAGILHDLEFDAPVNYIVNFPDFVEPWPVGEIEVECRVHGIEN